MRHTRLKYFLKMSTYLSQQIHVLNIPNFCVVFNIINLQTLSNYDNYLENQSKFISTPEKFVNFHENKNFKTRITNVYRDPCNIYFFLGISYNQTSQTISSSNLLFKENTLFLLVSEDSEFLETFNAEISDTSFLALSIAHTQGIYINLETSETKLICIPCQDKNNLNFKNINLKTAPHFKIPFPAILGLSTMGYGGPHCYKEEFSGYYFGRIPNECRGYLCAISILAGSLNLTLELDPFIDDENPNPFTIMEPLVMSLHLPPIFEEVLKQGGNFGLNAPVTELLYYCVPYSRFMRPDWAIFLEPFESWVWFSVILVMAGVCVLIQFKNSGGRKKIPAPIQYYTYELMRSGLFVLKGDPDAHIASNLGALPLLVISLLSYNFLQPEYLGRVTSAFITPGNIEETRDLYSLLTHKGYKLHFNTDSIINTLDVAILNLRMRGSEINWDTQISIWNDYSIKSRLFEYLFEVRNIDKTQESEVLSSVLGSGDHFVVGGMKCVILYETDFVINKVYVGVKYFAGRDVLRVFKILQETGFEKFWWKVESWGRGEYWRDLGNRFGSGVQSLSVYSHIQILFYIYLISGGIAIFVFLCEVESKSGVFEGHGDDVVEF